MPTIIRTRRLNAINLNYAERLSVRIFEYTASRHNAVLVKMPPISRVWSCRRAAPNAERCTRRRILRISNLIGSNDAVLTMFVLNVCVCIYYVRLVFTLRSGARDLLSNWNVVVVVVVIVFAAVDTRHTFYLFSPFTRAPKMCSHTLRSSNVSERMRRSIRAALGVLNGLKGVQGHSAA